MRKTITSLRNAILEPETPYYPEVEETQAWYRFFNREVFNKALPKEVPIFLKKLKNWGYCNIQDGDIFLELNMKYPTKRRFLEILVHEMVHIFQLIYENVNNYTNDQDLANCVMVHGPTFFAWKPKIEKYHLNLRIKYSH